ncbi:MAG: endonuclease III [Ignavibacteria bacterium]|nr:endonuclease III [Ignavibacteria bacterium]
MPRTEPTISASERRSRRNRFSTILRELRKQFPDPGCALQHHDAWELLAATILSAQCTDARVNMVTPALFGKYPDVRAMARGDIDTISDIIRSTGFFNAKAKNLLACARAIVERHKGAVPRSMEELTALPGVGRKTANVVLGNAFNIPGLAVDTHVARISGLLALTESCDPVVIERDLCALLAPEDWTDASHLLILHGRATCIARRPKCGDCIIARYCPSARNTP